MGETNDRIESADGSRMDDKSGYGTGSSLSVCGPVREADRVIGPVDRSCRFGERYHAVAARDPYGQ